MESKTLTPSANELMFTIEIKVFKNCQIMNTFCNTEEGNQALNFQSVIGALDIAKTSVYLDQNTTNIKHWLEDADRLKASLASIHADEKKEAEEVNNENKKTE